MERIIYISTARSDPDREIVEDILRVSRRNNRRDGLTGLLVVGGLGLRVACRTVNGWSYDSSGGVPYGAQRWW